MFVGSARVAVRSLQFVMSWKDKENKQEQQLEIGDEVIGDNHVRGTIVKVSDAGEDSMSGGGTVREYVVKSENGDRLVYAGEANLKLIRKGLGDAAPPRREFMDELIEDLRRRPLTGLRL